MNEETNLIEIEQEAISIREEIQDLVITDQPSYDLAVERRTAAVKWLKNAEAFFKPPIEDAHRLHKKLIAQMNAVINPTQSAITKINSALIAWDREQEKLRLQKQREAEEAARKEAEERRLAEALAMEAAGMEAESVQQMLDTPIKDIAPVVAEATYEKSSAVIYRDNWDGVCDDLWKLVKAAAKDKSKLALLQINQQALRQMAKSLKELMDIPGCRAVNKSAIASGRNLD